MNEQSIPSLECPECGVTTPLDACWTGTYAEVLEAVQVLDLDFPQAARYAECPDCGTISPVA